MSISKGDLGSEAFTLCKRVFIEKTGQILYVVVQEGKAPSHACKVAELVWTRC